MRIFCLEFVLYCRSLRVHDVASNDTRLWCHESILRVVARRKSFSRVSQLPGPNAPRSLRMQSVVDRSGCLDCPSNVLRRAPASSLPAVDLDHRIETMPLFVHVFCLSPLACAAVVILTTPHSVLTHGPRVECRPVVSTRPLHLDRWLAL